MNCAGNICCVCERRIVLAKQGWACPECTAAHHIECRPAVDIGCASCSERSYSAPCCVCGEAVVLANQLWKCPICGAQHHNDCRLEVDNLCAACGHSPQRNDRRLERAAPPPARHYTRESFKHVPLCGGAAALIATIAYLRKPSLWPQLGFLTYIGGMFVAGCLAGIILTFHSRIRSSLRAGVMLWCLLLAALGIIAALIMYGGTWPERCVKASTCSVYGAPRSVVRLAMWRRCSAPRRDRP
ncbi:MAG: hypothetical protein ACI8W8_002793 [Rhodothermales bacterium]|jgi:hypothetical protein